MHLKKSTACTFSNNGLLFIIGRNRAQALKFKGKKKKTSGNEEMSLDIFYEWDRAA